MQTFFLWNALTIVPDRKQSIAVVGGGGKTSLIFRLCEEMVSTGKKVTVTTTTHMAYEPERPFAEEGNAQQIQQNIEKYGYTVAASLDQNKSKIGSLTEEALVRLKGQADCILIEADGAKRLPLKVPGEWEPVIPDFTDLVVGVIGMDAVGQMIRESCHRPERVAAFLNKEQTDPVTEADVIRIAVSDKALKKAVGRRPYKIFLNKTDLMGKYESAERIGKELQEQGVHAAWGSLQGREYYR